MKQKRERRGKTSTCSSRIDEEVRSHNVAEHFANIYENPYNKVELGSKFDSVCQNVKDGVDSQSEAQINRVTDEVIKDAMNLMKAKKNDAIIKISSDFYLNGPPELIPH